MVDKAALLKICEEIADRKIVVQALYEKCVVYNKKSKNLMIEMYMYCFKIAFDAWLGKRIRSEIEVVSEAQSKESVFQVSNIFCCDEQTCTVKISVS